MSWKAVLPILVMMAAIACARSGKYARDRKLMDASTTPVTCSSCRSVGDFPEDTKVGFQWQPCGPGTKHSDETAVCCESKGTDDLTCYAREMVLGDTDVGYSCEQSFGPDGINLNATKGHCCMECA